MKKFHIAVTYPAGLDRILPMLVDPDYTRFRMTKAGASPRSVTVEGDPRAPRLTVQVPIPLDAVPAPLRRLVPAGAVATIVEAWHQGAGDRSPTGVMTASAAGIPATLRADFRLDSLSDDACERIYDGQVTVSVPLVGGSLETKVVDQLSTLVALESVAAAQFLSR